MKKLICNKGKKVLMSLLITGLLIGMLPVNSLWVAAADNETELILNGDFSEEVDPEIDPNPVPKWRGDGCSLSIGDDDGNPYMVIGGRGNGYASAQQSVDGNFKEGDVINYSYRLKAPADPRRYSRFVVKYQGDYVGIPEEPYFSEAPATEEWTEVSGTIELSRDASNLMFQIDDGSNDDGTASDYHGTGADIHIDDVSVKLERELVEVPITGVTVNPATLTLQSGQTNTLTATVQPVAATQMVTWSSSNSSVATVEQYTGVVTAVAAGTATITATSTADPSKTAACTITVPEVLVTGVTLSRGTLSLVAGTTGSLTATIQPANATNKNVTWGTSDASVATVKNGTVTAVAAGEATITVTSVGEPTKTAQCTVTVTPAPIAVTDVTLGKSALTLEAGNTETLTAAVVPEDATNKALIWDSSDISVATVNDGVVTAVAVGTATITVTSAEDPAKKAECVVTVTPATVPVTGVKIDKSTLSLAVKGTGTLVATVQPANATNKGLSWSTSNASVATVNNGKVTAVAAGTAKIIATSLADNTKKVECTVTVTASGKVLKKGDSFKSGGLNYKVMTVDAAKKSGTVQVAKAPGNKNLKTINIKNTVSNSGITFKIVSIAANAFKNNNAVTSVKIGKNVKEINNGAFSGCKKLQKVTAGAELTKIGKKVFLNNKQLKTIDLRKSKKLGSVGSKTFKGIRNNATIRVPKGRAAAYKGILKKGNLAKSVKVR